MLNDSNRADKTTSSALRLVTWCGECLAKTLNSTFDLSAPATKETFARFNEKWNFLFKQIIDPQTQRPQRRAVAQATFGWDPLQQREVDPAELMRYNHTNFEHTCMTNTTLLPRDGRMELFGANVATGIGIGCDLRLCDVNNERFVFAQDAFTDFDWWLDPTLKDFRDRFKSYPINVLRENTNLIERSDEIRQYNDILAGINAKSISMILVQPQVGGMIETQPGSEAYYTERFNAIYRKLYVSSILDRHLPIIIYDAKNGVSEYTLEEQQKDLVDFLAKYPSNEIANLLKAQNIALINAQPLENNAPSSSTPSHLELEILPKVQHILIQQIALHGDNNRLYAKINVMKDIIDQTQNDDSLKNFMVVTHALISALEDNNQKIATLDTELQLIDPDKKLLKPLHQLITTQKEVYAQISDKLLGRNYPFHIDYETMQQTIDSNKANKSVAAFGLTMSADANSKSDGIAQLYGDFTRHGLTIFGGRYSSDPDSLGLNSQERLSAFLHKSMSPEKYTLLQRHYSQGPLMLGWGALNTVKYAEGMQLLQPELEDRKSFLYEEKGEIYFEINLKRFPLKSMTEGELIGYIDGPMKLTFKLANNGFQFLSLDTQSPLIKEIFLGTDITPKYIAQHTTLNLKAPEQVGQYEQSTKIYLEHLQKIKRPSALTREKIVIVDKLLQTLHTPGIGPSQQIKNFHEQLAANRETLIKRRDNFFTTFVKSLGMVAIAILSLGVFAENAYERLLGKKASHGSVFVDNNLPGSIAKKPKL